MANTSVRTLRLRDAPLSRIEIKRSANGARSFSFPASSETPVARGDVAEVLSHKAGAIRLDRAKAGSMPILFNHNWDDPIGMVTGASVADRRLRLSGNLFDTARAAQVQRMIDGGLKNVSIGYQVHAGAANRTGDTYTATDWEPYEVSIVTVPADPTVGVGRTLPRPAPHNTTAVARRAPAPTVLALGDRPTPRSAAHAALHEASHAVALSLAGIPFADVRIFARANGGVGGEVAGVKPPENERGLGDLVLATLAGAAAANPVDDTYRGARFVTDGAAEDYRQAQIWIDRLDRNFAYSRRARVLFGSEPMPAFERRADNFVRVHGVQIYRIANELLAAKRLTAADIAEIIA